MMKQIRAALSWLLMLSVILSLNVGSARAASAFDCAVVSEIPQAECAALVALYTSTGGDGWSNHDGWLADPAPSTWQGVTVTGGHVTGIERSRKNLVGTLPPELGSLSELTQIDFFDNRLSGSIPASLGSLSKLTSLQLWGNQLTGSIPSELGNLSSVQFLSLGSNPLSGSIPASLGNLKQLTRLDIGSTNVSGSLPASFGGMTSLQILAMYGDHSLTGPLPPELGNLSQLKGIYFNGDSLTGPLPPELGKLANLEEIELQVNALTGPLPPELGNLSKLTHLNLRGNHFNGAIPPELGNLSLLNFLDLRYDGLSGEIPASLGGLPEMTMLMLSGNDFSGAIPSALGSLSKLTVLALEDNDLSGPVPDSLANLTNLADPGQSGFGMDGLGLGYNRLAVPTPYPSQPPTALEQFLAVKDPDWYQSQVVTGAVSSAGGTLVSRDDAFSLSAPAGAVAGTVTLEYVPQESPSQPVTADTLPAADLLFANRSFQLDLAAAQPAAAPVDLAAAPVDLAAATLPASFTFAQPVTIAVKYQDADAAGLYEPGLGLYYWDPLAGAWKDARTSCAGKAEYTRDLAKNTISVKICGLAEFALMGQAEGRLFLPMVGGR